MQTEKENKGWSELECWSVVKQLYAYKQSPGSPLFCTNTRPLSYTSTGTYTEDIGLKCALFSHGFIWECLNRMLISSNLTWSLKKFYITETELVIQAYCASALQPTMCHTLMPVEDVYQCLTTALSNQCNTSMLVHRSADSEVLTAGGVTCSQTDWLKVLWLKLRENVSGEGERSAVWSDIFKELKWRTSKTLNTSNSLAHVTKRKKQHMNTQLKERNDCTARNMSEIKLEENLNAILVSHMCWFIAVEVKTKESCAHVYFMGQV